MKATIIEKYRDYFEFRHHGLTFRSNDVSELCKFIKDSIKEITEIQVDYHASEILYDKLKVSGMLYEMIPTASGQWAKDKRKFLKLICTKYEPK